MKMQSMTLLVSQVCRRCPVCIKFYSLVGIYHTVDLLRRFEGIDKGILHVLPLSGNIDRDLSTIRDYISDVVHFGSARGFYDKSLLRHSAPLLEVHPTVRCRPCLVSTPLIPLLPIEEIKVIESELANLSKFTSADLIDGPYRSAWYSDACS